MCDIPLISNTKVGRRKAPLLEFRRKTGTTLRKGCLACLGPGLIAGASDDDPSGIATYSQTGAQYGLGMLWLMPYTFPLMAAIQEISARIGRTTGHGLARNMRLNYPRIVVYPLILLLAIANVINLAADLGAMGDCVHLLLGGTRLFSAFAYTACFAVLSVLLQIYLSYRNYAAILKWGALILGVYVITAFVIRPNWQAVGKATFVPSISWTPAYLATFVAVLGTTISPYLFFWQASLESEETRIAPGELPLIKAPEQATEQFGRIRIDTVIGMAVSNLVAFFIILTAGVTLHEHNITDVQTAQDAAKALEPLAGRFASLLFSLGIIGGGLLAIPVLGGSVAYAVGELMHWPVGQARKPHKAKGFYGILVLTTALGVTLNLLHINPIKALFWSAVINGVASVPIMIVIMLMFSSKKVMGKFTRASPLLRIIGWVATAVMTFAAIALFATWGQ